MTQFHALDGSIVKNLDGTSPYAVLQILRPEGLALHIEVGNIEFECRSERMSHHLLLEASAGHLPCQQLANNVYFAL
jgi:hypothetical protein